MNVHVSPDQEARGYLAEARFFHFAEHNEHRRPRGYLRAERASPILDVRGIDGFIWHYRGCTSATPKRIPIQLKTGYESSMRERLNVHNIVIPIIPISVDISGYCVFDRIRRLLDAHELHPRQYDQRAIDSMEHDSASRGELAYVELIERCRERYMFENEPLRA